MRTSFTVVSIALLVSACGTSLAPPGEMSEPAAITKPAPEPTLASPAWVDAPAQVPPATLPVAPNTQTPLPDGVTALLSYSERLRLLNPNELAAEIALQGDPGNAPLKQMQLSVALMQLPQAVDTARALGLLQRVVSSPSPDATPLKPLARLLALRLHEQRKLEEGLERQSQQLRENQRRIDQLSDRLEAMRAIERSLTTRPAAAPNGTRPPLP
jgi:hypothetical protein